MPEQKTYKWFVAHITYHNESNVRNLLDMAGLEYYMPFKSVSRMWKGVRVAFQIPAIPSCAFVRVAQPDLIMLRMRKELSLLLDGEGNPLSLRDEQMNAIRVEPNALLNLIKLH